ncbi:ABC transporter substrate-binding protein [Pseudarthrobacter sp. NPDC058329]|uniref:ABC transporter substrate-binding protein n=1 Tax=Pseudarthrobacter sp. NPDC058329 TaxID=3346448 RepID=UPI0036DBF1E0
MKLTTRVGRKARKITALVAVAGFALSACGSAGSSQSAENTLVIGIESEPDILDPQGANGWVTHRINHQIFEGLVGEDLSKPSAEAPVASLVPGLAESWDISPNGTTYTFKLREGVKFHDGTDFNAEAVEYNIRRMWDKASPQYNARAAGSTTYVWQHLSGVRVLDARTLELTLTQPFSPFLQLMTQGGSGSTGLISPAALQQYGDSIADHPVGTGPFKFEERVRGERVSLVRNDSYWGDDAKLERVVFKPIPDPSARVASIRSGETDIIAVPTPDSIAGLKAGGFDVVEATPPHIWYMAVNMKEEPMQSPLVRQAISYAIDRKGLATDILKDTALPAYHVQAPANPGYVPTTDISYPYDPAKAKELLDQAGYGDGFSTTLETSVDGSGQIMPVAMAEFIKQNLAQVGITVEIKTFEWISYVSHHFEGLQPGVGLGQLSWGMSTPYWLSIITDSSLIAPNGPNTGYYQNPGLEDVISKAIAATDETTANSFWAEADRIATTDLPVIPVVNDKSPYVLSDRVKNFVLPSEEWYDLTKVELGS